MVSQLGSSSAFVSTVTDCFPAAAAAVRAAVGPELGSWTSTRLDLGWAGASFFLTSRT